MYNNSSVVSGFGGFGEGNKCCGTQPMPKSCVITGANQGIGLEFVKQLRARGESVWGSCRANEGPLAELANPVGSAKSGPTADGAWSASSSSTSAASLLPASAGFAAASFDAPFLPAQHDEAKANERSLGTTRAERGTGRRLD